MTQLRAFIAIELPADVRTTLLTIQSRLKSGCIAPVKWVELQNLHLTLKFLGNIDADKSGEILEAVTRKIEYFHAFTIEMQGLGVFPSPRRAQVVWAGLGGDTRRLGELQKDIDAALVPLGFKPETRVFRPHLTIGRVRDSAVAAAREDLSRLVSGTVFPDTGSFEISTVQLIKSRLTQTGPVYTGLGSVALVDNLHRSQ